jgi:hypothetical protein
MSAQLEKARQQAEAGKIKAAMVSIRYAVPGAATSGDLEDARDIIALVDTISGMSDRRIQADCAEIRASMEAVIVRESGPLTTLKKESLGFLSGCRIIACAGIAAKASATREWALAFTPDRVALMQTSAVSDNEVIDVGWQGLELAIEGAGQVSSGGGFIGGGFGLEGAAVGMLAAGALNALTTSSHMDTVVHLQTPVLEVYLLYGQMTPEQLRRSLAPVFLRLRQEPPAAAPATSAGGDHVVDRLHKLSELLEKGLIDEGEFARLKADLMAGLS